MNMNGWAKRLVGLIAAIVLAAGASVSVSGCSNDEEILRKQIDVVMSEVMESSQGDIEEIVGDDGYEELSNRYAQFGTTPEELLQHCLKGMTYETGDIAVDGDTAMVKVTITTKDFSKAANDLASDSSETEKLANIYVAQGETAMYGAFFQDFYSRVDVMTDTTSKESTITFTKKDGNWTMDSDSVYEMGYSLFSDLQS